MKRLALLALILISATAAAKPGAEVRISPRNHYELYITGHTLPADNTLFLMYLKEPCALPLSDSREMRRFLWVVPGRPATVREGCWYRTLDGNSSFILADGESDRLAPAEAYPRAVILEGQMLRITEPDYDSRTFFGKQLGKATMEAVRRATGQGAQPQL
jgi:hypothetical protein